MSVNAILEETDGDFISSYKCEYHVTMGTITENSGKEIPSYVDFKHPCSASDQEILDSMRFVDSEVLGAVATDFNLLPEGAACTVPDTSLPVWLIGVSTQPDNAIISNLDCQILTTTSSNECCSVIYAPMTWWLTDAQYEEEEIFAVLKSAYNNDSVTSGTQNEVRYIGAFVEIPNDAASLPPAINKGETPQPQQGNNPVTTTVGAIIITGLVVVFIAVAFVLIRRRRRRLMNREIGLAISKSHDLEMDGDGSDGPTLEVDVMSDDIHDMPHNQVRNSYDVHDEYMTPSSYTFDLSHSMQSDIMGTYGSSRFGPTSMNVVPPYPMEDASDSEVDSWAQTDGTVGSLEERLEEITAEI